jgi:hypothetical protein
VHVCVCVCGLVCFLNSLCGSLIADKTWRRGVERVSAIQPLSRNAPSFEKEISQCKCRPLSSFFFFFFGELADDR